MSKLLVAVLVAGACSAPTPTPSGPEAGPPIDAPMIDGITAIADYDPGSGMHIDDDGVTGGSAAVRPPTGSRRPGRPIEVTLRSTPPKALAYVDGVALGPTPAFWAGEANGREHTFTFTLHRHGTAVYRFVPVASGVVHARLEATGREAVAPVVSLPAPPPIPAPPTVIAPRVEPPPDAAGPDGRSDAPSDDAPSPVRIDDASIAPD